MSPRSEDARPLIGLSCYREPARWGVWNTSADLLPTVYARAIEAVGGIPVLLPPGGDPEPAAATVVTRLDGLVVSGGPDVEPRRYGQEPHPLTISWREDRDAWELALLAAADAEGLPVLGICRGMQLMAVHAGGSLDQHTPEVVGHDEHNPGGAAYGEVDVQIRAGSRLAALVGSSLTVHCHHHQSVREHPGFDVAALAADGVVEAIEHRGDRFLVGVQWHPEMAQDAGLFRELVRVAAGRDRR